MSRLIHYSKEPLTKVISKEQEADGWFQFTKPKGLWISVEGEDDWAEWCKAENFIDTTKQIANIVELSPEANVLWIKGTLEFDVFDERYGQRVEFGRNIDWPRVATEYQGLIIAPYLWDRRLLNWYYGWDCASGCIWDAKAINKGVLV